MKRYCTAISTALLLVMLLADCGGGGPTSLGSSPTPSYSCSEYLLPECGDPFTIYPDVLAPTIPSGLTAAALSANSIACTWYASTDDVGVSGYQVIRNGIQIATTTTTTYTDTALLSNTTYTYTVAAYDFTGNTSAQSSPASAATSQPSLMILPLHIED